MIERCNKPHRRELLRWKIDHIGGNSYAVTVTATGLLLHYVRLQNNDLYSLEGSCTVIGYLADSL